MSEQIQCTVMEVTRTVTGYTPLYAAWIRWSVFSHISSCGRHVALLKCEVWRSITGRRESTDKVCTFLVAESTSPDPEQFPQSFPVAIPRGDSVRWPKIIGDLAVINWDKKRGSMSKIRWWWPIGDEPSTTELEWPSSLLGPLADLRWEKSLSWILLIGVWTTCLSHESTGLWLVRI